MIALEKNGEPNPSILKRGSKYFTIETSRFIFNDTLNFTSPCSLSNYLKQWKIQETKSIFPYQFFASVEDLKKCTEFPGQLAFYSSLKKEGVDDKIYQETRNYYNFCKSLPLSDSRSMRNMADFLAYYNCLDTRFRVNIFLNQ